MSLAAMAPLAANAADYDPPLLVEEAPEYVPVEVGSGWYLRGDIGYTFNDPFKLEDFGNDPIYSYKDEYRAFSGSVGVGYNITDMFRAEVNFGLLPSAESSLNYLTADDGGLVISDVSVSTDNQLWSGMFNLYADLGTFAGITPYIGGGIGAVYNKRSLNASEDFVDDIFVDTSFSDTKRQFDLAYSLAAGLSYAISKNVEVDLGYEYFASPGAEYAEITGPDSYSIKEGVDFHQVNLGLRYNLW